MKLVFYVCFIACSNVVSSSIGHVPADTQVSVETGALQGKLESVPGGQDVEVFLGIPYAEAPVGELRFASPRPPKPWSGVRDAAEYRANCPLTLWGKSSNNDAQLQKPQSEDCLFLNIHKPAAAMDDVPVMVWIHGGGFYDSGGMSFDGAVLASHNDVIVVTINYRLGLLGYLNVLGTELRGNYGMLDQVEALKWIQRNIRNFGGNPARVTIFGESAGGASVDLHVISPLSKGLFKYAIAESGFATSIYASYVPKTPEKYSNVLKTLNCDAKRNLLACLREKPLNSIIEAQGACDYLHLASRHPIVTVDGKFLPKEPSALLAEGNFNAKAVILGMNKHEGDAKLHGVQPDENIPPTKYSLDKIMQEVIFTTNGEGDIVKRAILQEYLNHTDPYLPGNILNTWSNIISDGWYFSRAIVSAHAYSKYGVRTYVYQFSHRSQFSTHPAHYGVPHFDEVPYVFGVPYKDNPDISRASGYTEVEKGLSSYVMRMWTNVAKYGNPNQSHDSYIKSKVTWPPYTTEKQEYLDISLEPSIDSKLRARRMSFWNDFVPSLKEIEKSLLEKDEAIMGLKDEL